MDQDISRGLLQGPLPAAQPLGLHLGPHLPITPGLPSLLEVGERGVLGEGAKARERVVVREGKGRRN